MHLDFHFIVTKNGVPAAEDPDCMNAIQMYYSSLPLPFILTVGLNCTKKRTLYTAACCIYVVTPCFVYIPVVLVCVVIWVMITFKFNGFSLTLTNPFSLLKF